MYEAIAENIADGVTRYRVQRGATILSYAEVIDLWRNSEAFRRFFSATLTDSPWHAFRWETPPISRSLTGRDFEFVLVEATGLARSPDTRSFQKQLKRCRRDNDVATFENLGRDALLVVPAARAADGNYVHLAAFLRGAPPAQVDRFWQTVGDAVEKQLSDTLLWVSTAGAGVAWLHLRLDSHPKYYTHQPYARRPQGLADG